MTDREPNVGMVARCAKGQLGLIMGSTLRQGAVLWVGVHLEGDRVGGPWQSLTPDVLGPMKDFPRVGEGPGCCGFRPVGLDNHGELELELDVEGHLGTVFISEDFYRAMGEPWKRGCP